MIREDALNAFESLFFHVESEQTPMNIGSLAIYDGNGWRDRSGRLRLAALRKHIRSRLCEIPRLLQHPVWPPARWAGPIGSTIRRSRLGATSWSGIFELR